MQYAQPLSPRKERSRATSKTALHNSRSGFPGVKLLLALNTLAALSLVLLLVLGWMIDNWARAILNLLFLLGFAG